MNSNGKKAKKQAVIKNSTANVLSQEELARKAHHFELEKSGSTIVCLDYAQNGIGSNSCGPKLRKQYCFQKEQFVCEWKLMFEEKSEKLSGNDCFCKEDRV